MNQDVTLPEARQLVLTTLAHALGLRESYELTGDIFLGARLRYTPEWISSVRVGEGHCSPRAIRTMRRLLEQQQSCTCGIFAVKPLPHDVYEVLQNSLDLLGSDGEELLHNTVLPSQKNI